MTVLRVVLSPAVRSDIRAALQWTSARFGEAAVLVYHDLLRQAIHDIAAEPGRPGSRERPELAPGLRTYHLFFSRGSAIGIVGEPRHLLVYRRRGDTGIDVIRVLHDARDIARHLPGTHRGG